MKCCITITDVLPNTEITTPAGFLMIEVDGKPTMTTYHGVRTWIEIMISQHVADTTVRVVEESED